MNLEELVEAHLAGQKIGVPDNLRDEFECAVAGHAALAYALGETLATEGHHPDERRDPLLPADYQVVRELGRGGMGVVYLVQQKSLGRLVAVKVLRPGEATFGKIVQRFLEEAKHLARLRHPNVVSVHEVGHAGDEPYFTMDFVDGQPLSAILARERMSPSQSLALWKQAAAGVQHAHAEGIIHRDLKPGNILVDAAGRAYVTDFGLARDMTQASQLTLTGEVMGTPAYMAPEQALGETDRIGETTDVHALGVILYEMLTGAPPYGRDAPANVLVRLLKEEPVPPRRRDRRIPRDLETICLKAIARESERRYATMNAFLEDIRRFEAGEPVLARRPGILYRTTRLIRRHARLTASLAAVAAVVLCLAWAIAARGANELVASGDAQHGFGRHRDALALYQRAFEKSGSHERLAILERIVRCAEEAGEREIGVEAGLQSLRFDPYAWVGPFDGDVARGVISHKVSVAANPSWELPVAISPPELAALRLRMFLAGPNGTSQDRKAAEFELANLARSLGQQPEESMAVINPRWKAPDRPAERLLEVANDESRPLDERAQAAYAGAFQLEHAGRRDEALAAYRRAFEVERQIQPVYFGLTEGVDSHSPRSLRWEPDGSRFLRHIAGTIRRLDPTSANLLRGGLRLRLTGIDLPPELGLHLSLSLEDQASTSGRAGGASPPAPRRVGEFPVQLDQTAWVGVADGRYRLELNDGSRTGFSGEHLGSRGIQMNAMLRMDFSDLPKEVEIRGETIDLPAIRAYLLEDIRMLEPSEGASVDFATTVFRWNAIPESRRYEIGFSVTTTKAGGTYYHPLLVTGTDGATTLRAAGLSADDAAKLRGLAPGSTGTWEVRAYDAQRRVIAKSPQQRAFTVGK